MGRLWAGTNSGLLCLQSNKDITKSIFRLYQSVEGLNDNIFLRDCTFKAADGSLYFGGHCGYIHFNPENLSGEVSQTKVHVTDIRIAGLSWYEMDDDSRRRLSDVTPQFVKQLSLAHDQNNFSIEFSSMNLENPLNEKYSYRLEGYDKTWRIAARFAHRATYNNMPPGHYRFQVRAMNENGSWSHEVHTIDIVVRPPFWLTWYAYTLYIILLAVIAIYVYSLHYSYSFLLQGLTDSTSARCSLFLFESRIYYILHRHRCAHADALPFRPFATEQHE